MIDNKKINIDRGVIYQQHAKKFIAVDNHSDMLRHGVFGLASEAGEVAGIMQKTYQGHGNPMLDTDVEEHMKKELGDCVWMIAEICTALGITLSDVMETNIAKLEARYPNGFEVEKSLHRAEGDI